MKNCPQKTISKLIVVRSLYLRVGQVGCCGGGSGKESADLKESVFISNLFVCLSHCIVFGWPGVHYVDTPFLTSEIYPPLPWVIGLKVWVTVWCDLCIAVVQSRQKQHNGRWFLRVQPWSLGPECSTEMLFAGTCGGWGDVRFDQQRSRDQAGHGHR